MDVYNLIIVDGKTLASDTPVCASAPGQTCNSLGPGLDCTFLTSVANPTHMTCRDGKTAAVKSNLKDPFGVCLDDTSSGPFHK